jgi:hypothetical protein
MSAPMLVMEWPDGLRFLTAPESLVQWEARGAVALGGCIDRARNPLRTDAEQATYDAELAARVAALMSPESDDAPAPSRPRK